MQDDLVFVDKVYLADDGSQDDTIARAQSQWTAQKTQLQVLSHSPNVGQWENLNRALTTVKDNGYDWVFILHSDDIAKPHWLTFICAQFANCSPQVASICSSWDDLMPDLSIKTGEDNLGENPALILGTPNATHNTLFQGCWWHISGAAIRLNAFDTIGDFDAQYSPLSDYEWLIRILNKGWSILYIPRTLILYRQHEKSISTWSIYNDRDLRQGMHIRQTYRQHLTRRDRIKLNLRSAKFALKRIARAILNKDFRKFVISTSSLILIMRKTILFS